MQTGSDDDTVLRNSDTLCQPGTTFLPFFKDGIDPVTSASRILQNLIYYVAQKQGFNKMHTASLIDVANI